MKIKITVGLPASGKTTWADEQALLNPYDIVFYCDEYKGNPKKMEEAIRGCINHMGDCKHNAIIFDGLFLTTSEVDKLLGIIYDQLKKMYFELAHDIEVHQWNEDKSSCLWNDKFRRDVDSDVTIKHRSIEDISLEVLSEKYSEFNFKKVKHKVMKKEGWKIFADKYGITTKGGDVKFGNWCLGGTWRDCWGGSGTVSSESPNEPEFFDELLLEICPDISHLKYKKLQRGCLTTDVYSEGDYYGGCVNYSRYMLNIPKLYELLLEMELISEEDYIQ